MKRFFKKHIMLMVVISVIVFLVLVFIVPIFINHLYKSPAVIPWLAMSWEAKDVLSFYGSILGATATIIALVVTITFTRKTQKEEGRLSIKPVLESNWCHFGDKLSNISEDDKLIFIDYSSSGSVSSESIPEEIKNYFLSLDMYKRIDERDTTALLAKLVFEQAKKTYLQKHFVVLYEIYNYGANNAVNVEFKIDSSNIMPRFCISTNEPKRFVLLFNEDLLVDNVKDINISFEYTDICSLGKYKQEEKFTFFKVDGKFESTQAFEYKLSNPSNI